MILLNMLEKKIQEAKGKCVGIFFLMKFHRHTKPPISPQLEKNHFYSPMILIIDCHTTHLTETRKSLKLILIL